MGNEEANSGILYKLGEAIDVSIIRIRIRNGLLDDWIIGLLRLECQKGG